MKLKIVLGVRAALLVILLVISTFLVGEDAEVFLEDCMAVVCKNIKEVREYFEEVGVDISEMSTQELEEALEVFPLPDGRYLVVEA